LSLSPSASPSVSVSLSPSISPSVSVSISPSISQSVSPSPSPGWTDYTRGNYAALPGNDNNLETIYSAQNITDVSAKDDTRVSQSSVQEYAVHQFKDFAGSSNTVNVECELQTNLDPIQSTVFLQIYNRNTTTWDTIDSDNSSAINTDFILTASLTDLINYKNASNVISCRVYQLSI